MDDVAPPTDTPDEPTAPTAVAPTAVTPATGTPTAETPTAPATGSARLHRSASHKLFGGVAGGLGERFDMDPNIFRIAFVVLTLAFGLGVVLYLAMWLVLPRDPAGDAHPDTSPRVAKDRTNWPYAALIVAVIVVALIAFSILNSDHTRFHGPGIGRGFFFVWVLILGALAVVALRSTVRRLSFLRFVALFFVIGLSAVVLASGAVLTYLASTGVPLTGGIGERVFYPTSLGGVHRTYRTEFGALTLDLRGVRFPAAGYRVDASVAVGDLTVYVAPNVVVDLRTHVGAGTIKYGVVQPWGLESEPFSDVPTTLSGKAIARAPHLTLDVQVGIGAIFLGRQPPTSSTNPPTPSKPAVAPTS
ncbi:MAG: PspC domain-containing protein [Acidimicrobiales bacterium]